MRRLGDISKADLLLKDANSYEPIRNRLHLQTFPKPFDYHNLTFPYDTIDLHELRVKETKSKNLPFIEVGLLSISCVPSLNEGTDLVATRNRNDNSFLN